MLSPGYIILASIFKYVGKGYTRKPETFAHPTLPPLTNIDDSTELSEFYFDNIMLNLLYLVNNFIFYFHAIFI